MALTGAADDRRDRPFAGATTHQLNCDTPLQAPTGSTAYLRSGASQWGSILPAVWSFMMVLRERAMGSAWTTIHLMDGGEAEAAEVLGIPFEHFTQAGLFPIAYTIGADFKPAKRLPLDAVHAW